MSNIIVISPPERVSSEIRKVIALFEAGLNQFHVRKPDFDDLEMISYISSIPRKFHQYIVLHSHFYLVERFDIKGIQLGKNRIQEGQAFKNAVNYYGYSAHSFEEIIELQSEFTHFFLSPVYTSISKPDYNPNYSAEQLEKFLGDHSELKVIALGGINSENIQRTLSMGFEGLAMLGNIWEKDEPAVEYSKLQKRLSERPTVLSIAGFDPCSGAGITADVKTFEQYKTQGLTVTTAITYQNEDQFDSVDWLSFAQIRKQIEVLFRKYDPLYIKIGLVENLDVLLKIIGALKTLDPKVKIIWDPILKASSQFDFHTDLNKEKLKDILNEIHLVTPNVPESLELFGSDDPENIRQKIVQKNGCNVLLKGGHKKSNDVTDVLIESEEISKFKGTRVKNNEKHGTGCVLSSAICAGLAQGNSIKMAIKSAKDYTRSFILSNDGLLGYHNLK